MNEILSVGPYKGVLRFMAIRMKDSEEWALNGAAKLMAPLLPDNAVLIPAPCRQGYATYTLKLAEYIAQIRGVEVTDICKGRARESFCSMKKNGITAVTDDFFGFYLAGSLSDNRRRFFIDNVAATGLTAGNMMKLIPGSSVLVLCRG